MGILEENVCDRLPGSPKFQIGFTIHGLKKKCSTVHKYYNLWVKNVLSTIKLSIENSNSSTINNFRNTCYFIEKYLVFIALILRLFVIRNSSFQTEKRVASECFRFIFK